MPGVRDTLEWAVGAGYLLFLFTNQSGVGRGYFTLERVAACNARMVELLGSRIAFAGTCVAPEAPDDPPIYRKPSPRFILETIAGKRLDASRCWMVGDAESDVQAGMNAGVGSVLVHCEPHLLPPQARVRYCATFAAVRTMLEGLPE